MNSRSLWYTAIFCAVFVAGFGSFTPRAGAVSIASDTAVYLSGPGITLILAAGGSLSSYSASATELILALEAGSTVTVKSNTLYTLTNSQSDSTQCSASPAYSYVTFSAASPATIAVTPSATVACSGTAPVISAFTASPGAITSGQSSTLSWSLSEADTVSIDHQVGSQSNASSSSTTVSPNQTTTYTLTATNYVGTTTAQTTVTVSAAPSTGGGGGGAVVNPPAINSFSASPPSIQTGQSSTLSWSLSGASTININPAVSTSGLNPQSGTATVSPPSTTTYVLTAFNSYGQSITASTTVAVLPADHQTPPSPEGQLPEQTMASSTPAYCLVNQSGTFFLILGGTRHGIANPGLLYTYGYGFTDAVADTAAYQSLPSGDLLGPSDGALVKAPTSPTVYLISGGSRHGFTSASVFRALGYKFSSVLTIPFAQLDNLPDGSIISDAKSRHLQGANASDRGTIYYLGDSARYPYPSLAVYNTWNLHNDFSRVVPANAADLALPVGPAVTPRSTCAAQ